MVGTSRLVASVKFVQDVYAGYGRLAKHPTVIALVGNLGGSI
jgi:hypothetical protein